MKQSKSDFRASLRRGERRGIRLHLNACVSVTVNQSMSEQFAKTLLDQEATFCSTLERLREIERRNVSGRVLFIFKLEIP